VLLNKLNKNHSILFLLPRFSGGGAERTTLNLLAGLNSHGYSVGIIVFDESGPLSSMVPDNVPIYNLGTLTLRLSIIFLVKKLWELKPKVIYSTLGYINIALLSIRLFLPRKTEVWVREANLPSISIPNNSYPKLMTLLYRFLYRTASKVICTSERMRKEFILDFMVSKEIIEILPNPIDVEMIHKSVLPVERFDRGGVCYIASGRLAFQKGFDRLLNWFNSLSDKKSTLTILGDGSLKNELIRQVELLNIQHQVKFVGFCDNPWKWYAGADVFLLSSRWEGMPNSVLESLTCGTPVIATEESGGIKEISEQKINNSVVIVSGAQQFVKAMDSVEIKNQNYQSNSLLPEKYKRENVIQIIEGWLDEIK
jgi:glycosyltransferase involved in cell wall biosynthesis